MVSPLSSIRTLVVQSSSRGWTLLTIDLSLTNMIVSLHVLYLGGLKYASR